MKKRSNWAVGEIYTKPQHDFRSLNLHDPHNRLKWTDEERPWWVRPLQVLGFVTTAVGVVTFFWFVTTLMLLLEGYPS